MSSRFDKKQGGFETFYKESRKKQKVFVKVLKKIPQTRQ
jgi:hypothetical protein